MAEMNARQPHPINSPLFKDFKMRNNFYVYLHKRQSDGIVFYVGKGRGKRAYYFHERNDHWHKTFNKHGCDVEIAKSGLSECEAFDLERVLITKFKSEKLCNKTDGGEGLSGYRFTEAQKNRLSESHKGYIPTEETRAKMSEANKGRKNPPHVRVMISERMKGNDFGRLRAITPELRAKLRDANKGEKSYIADKNVYRFKHVDGKVFQGTRYELKEKYGDCVRALFYTKPNKSVYGWSLEK